MDQDLQRAMEQAREGRLQGMKVNNDAAALDCLSAQEKRIVVLLLRGFAVKEIARKFHITEKTARNHLSHIYAKAKVEGRADLILWAVYSGILVLDATAAARVKQYACPGCEQPVKLRKRDAIGVHWAGTCACGTFLQVEFPRAA